MDYVPQTGDLVFFERAPGAIGRLIAALDWPNPAGMPVSHSGIVECDPDTGEPFVIENVWVDSGPVNRPAGRAADVGGVRKYSLARRCREHDTERRLLVVPAPEPDPQSVVDFASGLIGRSAYSIAQLLLSGLAALYRRMPCLEQPNPLWEKVHQHSRAIERAAPADYAEETCAATIAIAQQWGNNPLDIVEPGCQDPHTAWALAPYVATVIEALAQVALREARAVRGTDLVVQVQSLAREQLSAPDRFEVYLDGGDQLEDADDNGFVRFGLRAAAWTFQRLKRFDMVLVGAEYRMLHDLLVTYGVLDDLLQTQPDGEVARDHGEPVYLPLMSLGLMLRQLGCDGPYDPYVRP